MILAKIFNYQSRHGTAETVRKIAFRLLESMGIKKLAAYEQIQWEFEHRICKYLKIGNDEILSFYIIGAHEGREVRSLSRTFMNSHFTLFEPYPPYYTFLNKKFKKAGNFRIENLALSSQSGQLDFFQTNIDGSGSLFEPNSVAKRSYNMTVAEKINVEVITLDYFVSNQRSISPDILWVDVQGHELEVFKGGIETLKTVKAIFVEVAAGYPVYQGQRRMDDLTQLLGENNFFLCGLGTDPINFTGNAIYLNEKYL
ncbi:FkbM family methyltransferase [Planktomarina temperata]|nr:FkbM family methyltransferase [Planktomarina temperata]